jgi:hypothetical protein
MIPSPNEVDPGALDSKLCHCSHTHVYLCGQQLNLCVEQRSTVESPIRFILGINSVGFKNQLTHKCLSVWSAT